MEPFVLQEKEYFVLADWVQKYPNLKAGFTSKNGGQSKGDFAALNLGFHVHDVFEDVRQNRQILANKLSFPIENWIGAQQTHDVNIQKVSKSDCGKGAGEYDTAFQETDGFFTFEKNIFLTLCFADCVPIFFFHPESGAIGLAHAGWKGTVHGIAEEMIRTFHTEGIEAKDILVAIGPSICENCYIVDERVIKLVQNRLEGVDKKTYNLVSDHQFRLNLKECNRQILLKTGVQYHHIMLTNLCTSCHHRHFYSHRRDNGITGRLMGFIGWKEDNQ
nr:peptidoglycan editing factor PgeF [uncultured Bacillus sp.]